MANVNEIWKDVVGYSQYQISNLGNVKTTANTATRKERALKLLPHPKGYYRVGLYKNNKVKFWFVHKLVALHFIDNPDNKKTINHKNGDKADNTVDNLEWSTYRENMNHAVENKISACGERNGRSKLTLEQVNEVKSSIESTDTLKTKYNVSKNTINRIKSGKGWK